LSAGVSPQTPLGELTALTQSPLAGFKGPTSKGRGREREGTGKGREGKGGEGKEVREEEEKGGSFVRPPLGCFRRLW